MALTKHDIAEQIQASLGFPKNQSAEITEALLELIKSTLAAGEDVLVSGFGKFCVKASMHGKAGIWPLVMMAFCLPAGWSRSSVRGNSGTR